MLDTPNAGRTRPVHSTHSLLMGVLMGTGKDQFFFEDTDG